MNTNSALAGSGLEAEQPFMHGLPEIRDQEHAAEPLLIRKISQPLIGFVKNCCQFRIVIITRPGN